jgi:hypothetical protein
LKREQVTPRAPWEVSRRDLDAEPIRSVIERLRSTGKLAQLAQSELELGSRFVAAAESNQGVGCVRGADLGM